MPVWLIARLVAAAVVVATIVGAWLYVDRACWSTACHKQTARAEKAEGLLETARKRATDLAVLWAEGVKRTEAAYAAGVKSRDLEFAELKRRAADAFARGAAGAIRVNDDAARVLRDLSAAANAARPAAGEVGGTAATVSDPSPVSGEQFITPEAFAEFYGDAAESYRDVYQRWEAAVEAYRALMKQPPQPAAPNPKE